MSRRSQSAIFMSSDSARALSAARSAGDRYDTTLSVHLLGMV